MSLEDLFQLFLVLSTKPGKVEIYFSSVSRFHLTGLSLSSGIMSTPLGGGYIIFAFFAVRCPLSDVRRPASDVRRHAWFPLI